MSETVVIAIISGCSGAFITCMFQLINKWIDKKKGDRDREYEEAKLYRDKKEEVYIVALDRLLQIRRGFDYTSNDYMQSKVFREKVDADNAVFISIAPKLRLYSTDKIFRDYQKLALCSKYSFAKPNGPRLIENSKWAFDLKVTLLARLMQDELGYRRNRDTVDTIQCPECGTVHDIVGKCPKCGMTYEALQIKAEEIYKQAQEIQNNSGNEMYKDN